MSDAGRVAHDRHDLELVARAAAGDLDARDAERAGDRLATCGACARLAADLRLIAAATRELGPAAARAPSIRAPRDFRLTSADAARLRGRRFLGLGALPRGVTGPARAFGGALATLGLVGLLVSAAWPAFGGDSAGASVREASGSAVGDSAAPIDAAVPAPTDLGGFAASAEPPRTAVSPDAPDGVSPSTVSPIQAAAVASIVALVTGLVLLLTGRMRPRPGP